MPQHDPVKHWIGDSEERIQLAEELAGLFPQIADQQRWYFTPSRHLQGETPAEHVSKGQASHVLALIERMKSGEFD